MYDYRSTYLKRESFLSLMTVFGVILVLAGLVTIVVTATAPLPLWTGFIGLGGTFIGAILIGVGFPRGWVIVSLVAHFIGLVCIAVGLGLASANAGVWTTTAEIIFWIGIGLAIVGVVAGLISIAVYSYQVTTRRTDTTNEVELRQPIVMTNIGQRVKTK